MPRSPSLDRRHALRLALGIVASGLARAGGGRRDDTAAFLAAAREGRVEEVRRLLEATPALIGARDELGRSAFALAWLHGHAAVGEELRGRGYSPDLVERCLAGDIAAVVQEVGDDVARLAELPHPVGGNTLWAAARGGHRDVWRLQALGLDCARAANGGREGAVHAALAAHDPLAAWLTATDLLGNGASPHAAQGGEAPLAAARRRGDPRLVALLLRKGAADAAAAEASVARDHRTSRFAYDASGAPWKRPDLSDLAPALAQRIVGLSHADLAGVRGLVGDERRWSCAVSYQDELAVEACAHTGQREIVAFHLDRGAPLSLPTCFTAGDLARAKALLAEDPQRVHERGAHDFAVMWYPLIGGAGAAGLELLLAHGAPVDQESRGTTALHWAAAEGDRDAVALLLERGADVNAVGHQFARRAETPLAVAVRAEQEPAAALLRERGGR